VGICIHPSREVVVIGHDDVEENSLYMRVTICVTESNLEWKPCFSMKSTAEQVHLEDDLFEYITF
jgi:hypothetical protein